MSLICLDFRRFVIYLKFVWLNDVTYIFHQQLARLVFEIRRSFYDTDNQNNIIFNSWKMLSRIARNSTRNLSTKVLKHQVSAVNRAFEIEFSDHHISINDSKVSFAWLRDHCRYVNNLIHNFENSRWIRYYREGI